MISNCVVRGLIPRARETSLNSGAPSGGGARDPQLRRRHHKLRRSPPLEEVCTHTGPFSAIPLFPFRVKACFENAP